MKNIGLAKSLAALKLRRTSRKIKQEMLQKAAEYINLRKRYKAIVALQDELINEDDDPLSKTIPQLLYNDLDLVAA